MPSVDNAVIMAAGTSSRFAPLSYEKPKALIEVRGEVLIERQIRQLKEAGINDIYIVTGYKADMFDYLKDKFGVMLRYNSDYNTRNNNASIRAVEDILSNTYVCSADNYFNINPFEKSVDQSYYAAVYSDGPTDEWCIVTDTNGVITDVNIGGRDSWYMLGHTFWDSSFSQTFVRILDDVYNEPETADKLWENIYLEHLDELHMMIKKYPDDFIFEFDTLDELRRFDQSYIHDTRSGILKDIAGRLDIQESDISGIKCIKADGNDAVGFSFKAKNRSYRYMYDRTLSGTDEPGEY